MLAVNFEPHRPRKSCKRMVGPERSSKSKGPKGEEKWRLSLLSEGKVETTVENPGAVGEMEGVWTRSKVSYEIIWKWLIVKGVTARLDRSIF